MDFLKQKIEKEFSELLKLKWCYYQMEFVEFLGLSHRIPRKIKNTVHHLEISALVPEMFKFLKTV